MKHKYAFLSSLFMLALSTSLFAQATIERPLGFTNASDLGTCETLTLSGTSFDELMARADQLEATKGQTINGRVIFHDANASNFGTWTELSDGTKVWRATLHSPDAMSVCAYFDGFYFGTFK